jgi:hypothetical protein
MNEYFEIMDTNSIKPEKAKKILEEHGMQVTLKEAKTTLDFLNLISKIAISTYLDGPKA